MVFSVSNNIVSRCALGRKFEEDSDGDGDGDGELDEFMDQIIEERKDLDEVNPKNDLLSVLLQLQKDGKIDMELTQDNIKAILLDMFIGGSDTTSTTTEWLMAELLKHPNTMKKLCAENLDMEEVYGLTVNKKIPLHVLPKSHFPSI
ncbi:hypothetical protein V6N13_060919 [Hibiscus sabdariffa]